MSILTFPGLFLSNEEQVVAMLVHRYFDYFIAGGFQTDILVQYFRLFVTVYSTCIIDVIREVALLIFSFSTVLLSTSEPTAL